MRLGNSDPVFVEICLEIIFINGQTVRDDVSLSYNTC